MSANCFARSNSDRSPLYDVRNHACCSIRSEACETVDLRGLWSGYEVVSPPPALARRAVASGPGPPSPKVGFGAAAFAALRLRRLVEPDGIEPTTSCLQST